MIPTLTPAYGRDYRSQSTLLEDWDLGLDFIYNDVTSPYDGKPINKIDAETEGIEEVKFRYNDNQMVFYKKL